MSTWFSPASLPITMQTFPYRDQVASVWSSSFSKSTSVTLAAGGARKMGALARNGTEGFSLTANIKNSRSIPQPKRVSSQRRGPSR